MKKETYLFKLIDEYLYPTSLGCMAVENYSSEEQTEVYAESSERLASLLKFYDEVYSRKEKDGLTEEEIDVWLEWIVQKLKRETIRKTKERMTRVIDKHIKDAERYVEDNFFPERGREEIIKFVEKLREDEKKGK